jgi:transcription-repair coupling factor (superfamily II helicase)
VADGPRSLDRFHRDLASFAGERAAEIAYYPAWESLPGHGAPPHADLIGDRFDTLQRLLAIGATPGPPATGIVVTCIQALMQRTVTPAQLRGQSNELRAGHEVDLDELLLQLEEAGFAIQVEVHQKGEAARRGGILDLWPATSDWPVRVEFFGSTVESLRTFDPATQSSQQPIPSVHIAPAEEKTNDLRGTFADFVPAHAGWGWLERESIEHHAALYEEVIREAASEGRDGTDDDAGSCRPDSPTLSDRTAADSVPPTRSGNITMVESCTVTYADVINAARGPQLALVVTETSPGTVHQFGYEPFEGTPEVRGSALQPDLLEEQRRKTMADLCQKAKDGWAIAIGLLRTAQGAARALRPARPPRAGAADGRAALRLDRPAARPVRGARRPRHREIPRPVRDRDGRRAPGGADRRVRRQGASLYVPVAQAHLLSRYVGMGRHRPTCTRWAASAGSKEKVRRSGGAGPRRAAAANPGPRDALPGHAFSADTPWQHEFEAAFPYRRRPTRRRPSLDVKATWRSTRPMDRLVCGDVGYGKTEVAMRAAFKAVMDGKQVAMLVPTTILAQQHFDTSASAWPPTRCASKCSAASSPRASRTPSWSAGRGRGGHRHRHPPPGAGRCAFKDLGLVIIDEEQRFGVKHKEHLKHVRSIGGRADPHRHPHPAHALPEPDRRADLSVIATAPVERLPVETIVAENTDEVVRDAILQRAEPRGAGVLPAQPRADHRSRHEAPAAAGAGGPHRDRARADGRGPAGALIMRAFVRGDFDVLLCTTIIESGLDIPNVNTILIDRADRFGLAELYQLRGRVRAY